MQGRKREPARRKSRRDNRLGMDRQEHLQVRNPAGVVIRLPGVRAGLPWVLVEVMMAAEMGVNDARPVVILVMVIQMRVDERGGQRSALKGERERDRDQATGHGGIVTGSWIPSIETSCS